MTNSCQLFLSIQNVLCPDAGTKFARDPGNTRGA